MNIKAKDIKNIKPKTHTYKITQQQSYVTSSGVKKTYTYTYNKIRTQLFNIIPENYATQDEVVSEMKQYGVVHWCLPKRTLRYYVTHGVITRPMKLGKQVYFNLDYIRPALVCIILLKMKMCASLQNVKRVLNAVPAQILLDRIINVIKIEGLVSGGIRRGEQEERIYQYLITGIKKED